MIMLPNKSLKSIAVGGDAAFYVRLIMRSTLFAIIAVLLVGCVTMPDPIDRLVASLSLSHGLWTNGIFLPVGLPVTASARDVVSKVLERQFSSCKILKIRQVSIPFGVSSELYTAALIQTGAGEKIVLIKYEAGGWWNRIYDAKTSAKPVAGANRVAAAVASHAASRRWLSFLR
jgi:hypothetical protein